MQDMERCSSGCYELGMLSEFVLVDYRRHGRFVYGERKRQQAYRSEFYGQLTFDLKGMEDAVPSIDFSPSGSSESDSYSLQRSDVDHVIHVLSDLETYVKTVEDRDVALAWLREIHASPPEEPVQRTDALESGAYGYAPGDITQLKAQVEGCSGDHEIVNNLERKLRLARTQLEGEALSDATAQTKHVEILRQVLVQTRAEFEEVKALEARSSTKLSSLLAVFHKHEVSKQRPDLKLIVTSEKLNAEKMLLVEALYNEELGTDYLDASLIPVMQIHLSGSTCGVLLFFTGQVKIDMACSVLSERMQALGCLEEILLTIAIASV
ncbi:hypothetical protein K488DRAFT_83184 [Vararia minispora EC-137]|uniref:Uncharacterized protein n=1 Tax=Vararia minispora EC-137 TaxID=1314806 RepID=A0ACB8QV18_9AGAM|nr:hypothetical protein K488DRAFT_83184 [Vararia minispora EC-137]